MSASDITARTDAPAGERIELRTALAWYADLNNWFEPGVHGIGWQVVGDGSTERSGGKPGAVVSGFFIPDGGSRARKALTDAEAAALAPDPSAAGVAGRVSDRSAASEALRMWHRDTCYPEASKGELEIGLDAVMKALAAPPPRATPAQASRPDHLGFHLLDDKPFVVETAEGSKALGKGWIVVTEAEFDWLTAAADRVTPAPRAAPEAGLDVAFDPDAPDADGPTPALLEGAALLRSLAPARGAGVDLAGVEDRIADLCIACIRATPPIAADALTDEIRAAINSQYDAVLDAVRALLRPAGEIAEHDQPSGDAVAVINRLVDTTVATQSCSSSDVDAADQAHTAAIIEARQMYFRMESRLDACRALERRATQRAEKAESAIAALQRDTAISRRTAGPESGYGVGAASYLWLLRGQGDDGPGSVSYLDPEGWIDNLSEATGYRFQGTAAGVAADVKLEGITVEVIRRDIAEHDERVRRARISVEDRTSLADGATGGEAK